MMTDDQLKAIQDRNLEIRCWIHKRINRWEEICETHKDFEHTRENDSVFDQGLDKGIIEGLYQVMEFIEGTIK